jgi:hypothetical protein
MCYKVSDSRQARVAAQAVGVVDPPMLGSVDDDIDPASVTFRFLRALSVRRMLGTVRERFNPA